MRDVRVFISSPGDAVFERQRIVRILERLNGEFAGAARFVPIRWEDEAYKAHATFQAQIPEAADCDIVIAIFRARLGSALPEDFAAMPDGEPYPSGTAYEVLTAIAARRDRNFPDVYVFRHTAPPSVSLDDPARPEIEEQWRRLKAFFEAWFRTPKGEFKAAFQPFTTTDDFERQAANALRKWIAEHIPDGSAASWSIAQMGSPFRGLEPFSAKHAPVFFGRSRETARAIDALKDAAERDAPFLLLLGPSGSGKSSLARAGLATRLTAPGAVSDVDVWRVAAMRPSEGASPLSALAAALFEGPDDLKDAERGRPHALPELASGDFPTPETLAAALQHFDIAAAQPIVRALDKVAEAARRGDGYDRPVNARLLILADQLDELFAERVPAEARSAFSRLLARLASTGRVWIVATLRDELYSAFQKEPALRELRETGTSLDLLSPGPVELAELIRGPAEAAGLTFEKDLATGETLDVRLLRDAERGDLLPLLQFTLNRLYEGRDGARLTFAAYKALGGIEGAVDKEAERAIGALPEAAQQKLGRLIRQLATPASGASGAFALDIRPARLAEAETDEPSRQLVKALIDARILLSSGKDDAATVSLAHARVLQSWRRAKDIAEQSADFYRVRSDVEEQFRRWVMAKEPRDRLIPSGLPLAEAETMAKRFPGELSESVVKFIAASGRRARAFQRRIAVAAVVFLGLAIAAGFFGLESRRAEHRAQTSLSAAKQAVDGLIFDVAQGLQNVEGMRAESLRKILETAERTMTDLVRSAPDDVDLQRSRAAMFLNFGDIYEKSASLGALDYYEKASGIFRKLAVADPSNALRQNDVSVCLERIGDSKLRSGDAEGALKAHEESLAIRRKLAAADPGNADWRRDLSVGLNRLGDFKLRSGDAGGALKAYEESLAIARKLAAADPGNAQWQRDISVSLNKLGDIKLRSGDAEGALKAYEESLVIRRKLAVADPSNAQWRRDVSVILNKLGNFKLRSGDAGGALKAYEESLAIARKLAAADPGNAEWRRDVSVILNKLGNFKLRSGDAGGALKAYEESLAIARNLAAADPGNVEWQRDVSVSLNKLGDIKLRSGDAEGARKAYEEDLAIARKLAAADPGNAEWQRDVSVSLYKLGNFKLRGGDAEGALGAYEESLAIGRKLAAADPGNADWQRDVSVNLNKLADVKLEGGDAEGALRAYQESLAIRRKLAAADPGNADWQRDLSASLSRLADLKLRSGDAEGALKAYEEGLIIARKLIAADPGNAQWQRDVSVSLNKLGDLKLRSGDSEGALKAYEEDLAIARKLAAADPGNVEGQTDLVVSYVNIAQATKNAGRRKAALEDALRIVKALDAKGVLSADQKKWRADIEAKLAKEEGGRRAP
jgi:eukaryotic-like serine/threonine-protein kinase